MQVSIRIWGVLDAGASQMALKPRHLVGLGQGNLRDGAAQSQTRLK